MKPLNYLIMSLTIGSLLIACQAKKEKTTSTNESNIQKVEETKTEIDEIETAHHKAEFLAKEAVQFDIELSFGGKKRLEGTITTLTNSTKSKIELKDGTTLFVIGDKVYHPTEYKKPRVRFTAYTWTYFFMLPYKLSDNGTHWSEFGNELLNNTPYNIQKLTFGNGVGDSPDDWYYIYNHPENHLLSVAAYIVTYGKSIEKAEKNPHAMTYDNFVKVDEIPFATQWKFWEWTRKDGLKKQIGEATISNIKFLNKSNISYDVPDDYIKIGQ